MWHHLNIGYDFLGLSLAFQRGYGIIVAFPRWDGVGWVVGAEFSSRRSRVFKESAVPLKLGRKVVKQP